MIIDLTSGENKVKSLNPDTKYGRYILTSFTTNGIDYEEIYIGYVAVIGHKNNFKVYYNWGARNSLESIYSDGMKIRNRDFAYNIFPELSSLQLGG